jgi:hypothetical protein
MKFVEFYTKENIYEIGKTYIIDNIGKIEITGIYPVENEKDNYRIEAIKKE